MQARVIGLFISNRRHNLIKKACKLLDDCICLKHKFKEHLFPREFLYLEMEFQVAASTGDPLFSTLQYCFMKVVAN